MLQTITIRNYAIIEQVEMQFHPGFNVIIGETGAGKSILMGALGLALGKRADGQVLLNKEQKCVVEAQLHIADYGLVPFFDENELDYSDTTIIRREILPNGKSRAFVNDLPVTLDVLKGLTSQLIDIHAQQETRELEDDLFFIKVLDKIAGNDALLNQYQEQFKELKHLEKEISQFEEASRQFAAEYDYLKFQFDELESIPLSSEAWKALEEELALLQHAETIQTGLGRVLELLDAGEVNIIGQLTECVKVLQQLSAWHSEIESSAETFEEMRLQTRELHRQLQSILHNTQADEGRLQELLEKHGQVLRLMQKHQCKEIEELISLHHSLRDKLAAFSFSDEKIAQLKQQAGSLRKKVLELGRDISLKRMEVSSPFTQSVAALLREMGMPYANVDLDFRQRDQPAQSGIDQITFLFAPNKGSRLQPLDVVGSGGERSRLMLAIKSQVAKYMALPTLIFDEIDTGISGEVARKTGDLLRQIAQHHQVITITHLPQIAAKGQQHYLVYKDHEKDKSMTAIRALNGEDTVFEIARMLSGDNPSQAAMENARLLIKG
jgi:DNA repair protein RecN (Recombination protein N)